MALSNRFTSQLSLVKPIDLTEKENENETEPEVDPISEEITRPFKALATVVPQEEPFYQPDPAELNPALFGVAADTNPILPAVSANDNPMLLAHQPAEVPLYMRNPGPPPKLPRNLNVKSLGRSSYRFQQVQFGYTNRRTQLYICALIGIILLFVIIVIRPQDRKVENNIPVAVAANSTVDPAVTKKPFYSLVTNNEQFAVVTDAAGFVLEEPHDGAMQIQNLSQFTFIALQRKSDDGWYQLKGGAGWIKASSVTVFPSEETAWGFKNSEEAKIKG